MFFNKNIFGARQPFNFGPIKFKGSAPTGPQTQPTGPTVAPPQGDFQGAPKAMPAQREVFSPGSRVARSLLETKFNRDNPTVLGAIGNVFDQGVDAWTNKHGKYKGWADPSDEE